MVAPERQHALAATNSYDEPAFSEDHCDATYLSSCWRTVGDCAHEQGYQGDAYAKPFHDVLFLFSSDD
jgi:hypothetical protein